MEKVQVKIYMPKFLSEKLDKVSKSSGFSKSHIVSEATKKEMKRRVYD